MAEGILDLPTHPYPIILWAPGNRFFMGPTIYRPQVDAALQATTVCGVGWGAWPAPEFWQLFELLIE